MKEELSVILDFVKENGVTSLEASLFLMEVHCMEYFLIWLQGYWGADFDEKMKDESIIDCSGKGDNYKKFLCVASDLIKYGCLIQVGVKQHVFTDRGKDIVKTIRGENTSSISISPWGTYNPLVSETDSGIGEAVNNYHQQNTKGILFSRGKLDAIGLLGTHPISGSQIRGNNSCVSCKTLLVSHSPRIHHCKSIFQHKADMTGRKLEDVVNIPGCLRFEPAK